jgi:hypothetical protein
MNCLGLFQRDSGQSRVPEPPHKIKGMIFLLVIFNDTFDYSKMQTGTFE